MTWRSPLHTLKMVVYFKLKLSTINDRTYRNIAGKLAFLGAAAPASVCEEMFSSTAVRRRSNAPLLCTSTDGWVSPRDWARVESTTVKAHSNRTASFLLSPIFPIVRAIHSITVRFLFFCCNFQLTTTLALGTQRHRTRRYPAKSCLAFVSYYTLRSRKLTLRSQKSNTVLSMGPWVSTSFLSNRAVGVEANWSCVC